MTPEEYYAMHQKAFRCAFDYLNAHFPPGEDMEWWKIAAVDASKASAGQGENRLVIGLLAGVYDYLADEWKKRRDSRGETEHRDEG